MLALVKGAAMPNVEQRANQPIPRSISRRTFLRTTLGAGAAALMGLVVNARQASAASTPSRPSLYPQATGTPDGEIFVEDDPAQAQPVEGEASVALEPQLASPLPLGEIQVESLGEGKMLVVGGENPAAGAYKGEKLPVIARDGLVGFDFKVVSGIPIITLNKQQGPDSFNFAVLPDSGRVQFVKRVSGNRQVVAQQGNLQDLFNSRETTSIDVVYEGNRAWGMVNGETVLQSDQNHLPEGETHAYAVRSGPYNGVDTAVLLTSLRVASLANSEPSRYSSLIQPETKPAPTSELPPFLQLDKEMAGAVFNLKVLNKPLVVGNQAFLTDPNNYYQGFDIPAYDGRTYDYIVDLDRNRIRTGADIETVVFRIWDGQWVRWGKYGHLNVEENQKQLAAGFIIEKASDNIGHEIWIRVRVDSKTALVQKIRFFSPQN